MLVTPGNMQHCSVVRADKLKSTNGAFSACRMVGTCC